MRELLAAMNTGHTGGGGTIHANTAADVPARLTALGALAGMSQEAVRLQAASAIDAVIHLERQGNGRSVACIAVMEDGPAGLVVGSALEIFAGRPRPGPGWPRLLLRLGLDADAIETGGFDTGSLAGLNSAGSVGTAESVLGTGTGRGPE